MLTRVGGALLRDWPLKLAAVGLATVLYAGVAISENTRTWSASVPIEVLRPPAGGALLEPPGSVTGIRFRAPLDVVRGLTSGSFRASIDLSVVEPRVGADPVAVPVNVFPLDPRVDIVDFTPRSVNVRLDQVVTRRVAATIDHGTIPEGIGIGPVAVDPSTVVLEGASSRLAAVRSVLGLVVIDASGINVEQDVTLEALDEAGITVPGVVIRPATVRVSIPVARQLAYATLPVVPEIAGEPAAGHRVAGVTVTPQTVTVGGEEPSVRVLTFLGTAPLDIAGAAEDVVADVALVLPTDVTATSRDEVRIVVDIEPVAGATSPEPAG